MIGLASPHFITQLPLMTTHKSETSPENNTSSEGSECEDESSGNEDEESVAIPLLSTPTSPQQKRIKPKANYPARTNAAGIPVTLQKELAQDIQAFGGLEKFKETKFGTSKLCKTKPDTCGVGGSQLRQKVRDKLKQWKKLSLEEYQTVLNDLGIWTSEQSAVHARLTSRKSTSSLKQPTLHREAIEKQALPCLLYTSDAADE